MFENVTRKILPRTPTLAPASQGSLSQFLSAPTRSGGPQYTRPIATTRAVSPRTTAMQLTPIRASTQQLSAMLGRPTTPATSSIRQPSYIGGGIPQPPSIIPQPSYGISGIPDRTSSNVIGGRDSIPTPAAGGRTPTVSAAPQAAATPAASASLGELGSGLGGSLTNIGSGIMNTITQLLPLAIKVVLAVIVIKIVLWLLRGRR